MSNKAYKVELPCVVCGALVRRVLSKVTANVHCGRLCYYKSRRKRPYEWLYTKLCTRAKDRSVNISLTYEEFLSFTTIKTCHYCDGPVLWAEFNARDGLSAYNLDRKDVSLNEGYFKDNLVVCCGICNFSKGDRFSYEQWGVIGGVIRGLRNSGLTKIRESRFINEENYKAQRRYQ